MDPPLVGTNPAGLEGTKSKCTRNLGLLLKTNKIRVCSPSEPWGVRGVSAANPEQMKLAGEFGCFEVQAHSFPLGPSPWDPQLKGRHQSKDASG